MSDRERALVEAAINQNDAMRQELAYIGNLVSDLARAMGVDQANDDGSWPDLAGRIGKITAFARHRIAATPQSQAALVEASPALIDLATAALIEARNALKQHWLDWDGEPEDRWALRLAWAKCDQTLSILSENSFDEVHASPTPPQTAGGEHQPKGDVV